MNHHAQFSGVSNRPLYSQAVEALRQFVIENKLQPGDPLPAGDVLAKHLNISLSTLREAVSVLESEGLITRKQGAGTFVAAPPQTRSLAGLHQLVPIKLVAAAAGLTAEQLERQVDVVPATEELASLLRVAAGNPLLHVGLTVGVDGRCISYFDSYAPTALIDPAEFEASDLSVLEFCLQRKRPKLSHTRSELHAINANEDLAGRLNIPKAEAVLHLREVYYTEADEPAIFSNNYHVTDRFNFRIVRHVVDLAEWLVLTSGQVENGAGGI